MEVTDASSTTISATLPVFYPGCTNFLKLEKQKENDSIFTINVYPNPADNAINVAITNDQSEALILELFDVFGRSVKHMEVKTDNEITTIEIETSLMARGAYFIKAFNSKKSKIASILIQ